MEQQTAFYPKTAVLSGGVGASRFLYGLVQAIPAACISAIVNTGDDLALGGLYISPDVDIVTCMLAGLINEQTGWGIANDTFACRDMLKRLGVPTWFNVGDRDLALHLYRTSRLNAGCTLTQVTQDICGRLNVDAAVLPMSDDRVTSMIRTKQGDMTFEEYLIKHRCGCEIQDIYYAGADTAVPTPQALQAICEAELIFFAPSNPFVSIGTILSLPGVREALRATRAPKIAISPLVSGQAVKGPAARMLQDLRHEVSAAGVAALYAGLVDGFVLDMRDWVLAPRIEAMGCRVHAADTMMVEPARRQALAREAMLFARTFFEATQE